MGLITTKEELKEFLSISTNTEIDSVAPYIERAEREFIIPQIGSAMYNDVVAFYNSTGTPEADAPLLKKVQEAVVNFAFFLYADLLAVHVSESGIQRIEQTDRKTAYQYQENNFKNSLAISGYEVLGNALEYLEKYKTTYTIFAADTFTYNQFKYLTIHTPTLFQQYFDIKNSWATFFALRSSIKKVEDLFLEPVLGADFLTELKTEIKNDGTTNADLIELVRKAVVFLTIADATDSKLVQFGKDGTFEVRLAGTSVKKEDPADLTKISSFVRKNQSDGELYLKRLTEHLNKNASAIKYATYFSSENYQDITAEDYSTTTFTNSIDKKSFTL